MSHTLTPRRLAASALALTMLLSSLTGCSQKSSSSSSSSLTADEVATSMQEALSGATSYALTMSEDVTMTSDGELYDYSYSYAYEIALDPEGSKLVADYNNDGYTFSSETYCIKEADDFYIAYVNYDGDWYYYTSEDEDLSSMVTFYSFTEYAYTWSLAGDTQTVDGSTCYVLTGTTTGADTEALLQALEVASLVDDADSLDLSSASAQVVFYVDTTTFLPVSFTMDLAEVLQGLLGDQSTTVESFVVSAQYSDWNSFEEITLPEEAMDASSLSSSSGTVAEETDYSTALSVEEDGGYTMVLYNGEEFVATFTVNLPSGYVDNGDSASDMIFFELDVEDDLADWGWGYCYYAFDPGYTDEEIVVITESYLMSYQNYLDYFTNCTMDELSPIGTVTVGDLEVCYRYTVLRSDDINIQECVSWAFINGECLEVDLVNYDYTSDASTGLILTDVASAVVNLWSAIYQ